jgi:hypothetical protein
MNESQNNLARSMRAANESWETIAAFCGVSIHDVRKHLDADYMPRRKRAAKERAAIIEKRMTDIRAAVAAFSERREQQYAALCRFRRIPGVRSLTALIHTFCDYCEVTVTGPPWEAVFSKAVKFMPGMLADGLGGEATIDGQIILIEGDIELRCVADEFDLYEVNHVPNQ